jgi:hypothetical protein
LPNPETTAGLGGFASRYHVSPNNSRSRGYTQGYPLHVAAGRGSYLAGPPSSSLTLTGGNPYGIETQMSGGARRGYTARGGPIAEDFAQAGQSSQSDQQYCQMPGSRGLQTHTRTNTFGGEFVPDSAALVPRGSIDTGSSESRG